MSKSEFSTFGKGTFPAWASLLLESPLRKLIKSPSKVADRLALQETDQVLEIGAGSGYYSVEVASRLSSGRLTMVDVQQAMLDRAANATRAAGLSNIELHLADAASLPLTAGQFDVVFMVTVLGEVSDPEQSLIEAYRVLRQGGRLSISEQRTDPDFLSLNKVKALAKQAGFIYDSHFGIRWNYTANFCKA